MHKNKPVVAAVFRLRGKLSTAPEEEVVNEVVVDQVA